MGGSREQLADLAAETNLDTVHCVIDDGLYIDSDAAARISAALEPGEALAIRITGVERGQYAYDLTGVRPDAAVAVRHVNGIAVVIGDSDRLLLHGARLAVRDGALVMVNPNRPARTRADLPTGLIADDQHSTVIRSVLAEVINPNLDAHGGSIAYVGHDSNGTVYLTMHGGCTGCAMASSTMFDGVERVLTARVDGVEHVVDVTDHTTGTSPYYR